MKGDSRLKKLEDIDFLECSHTERIQTAYMQICEITDEPLQEEIRQLAEMTYREGILDGIRFYSRIVEKIC